MPYKASIKYSAVPMDNPHRCSWVDPIEDDELKAKARASNLIDTARNLENTQRQIHEQNLWNAQLYSNREMSSFDWGTGALHRASFAPISRKGENVVQMVIDAMVSLVGKNRPKATPVMRGASWKLRRQVKKLDKYIWGEFLRTQVYTIGKRCFRDGSIFSFGCAHLRAVKDDEVGDRIEIERVFPDEIIVDQAEAVHTGKVRHFYRRRVLPVEVVADMFGCDEEELMKAQEDFSYLDHRPVGKGWVVLIEGWQTKRGKRAGKYMASVKGMAPLAEETWDYDWVPFVFFHYQDEVSGFYQQSAVEQALPFQIRLNELNEVIEDAQDMAGRMRLLVAKGSQVNPGELTSRLGRIIQYTGIKPEAVTWQAVSTELYREREHQIAACLAQFGLNETSTSAAPPPSARFDSSAAFREFNAIQDGRLSDLAQRFEQFYLDIATRMIQVLRASGAKPKTVWYSGGRRARAEEIDWSELDLDDNAYVLSLQASSIMNLTPSGIRDELEKQLAQQLITPEEYRKLTVNPDLEGDATIASAAAEDIDAVIELLEDGEFENPEAAQDLPNGILRVTLAYLNARRYKDVDAEVLLNMLNWITIAKSIVARGTEASAEEEAMAALDSSTAGVPTPGPGGGVVSPAVPPMGSPTMTPNLPMPGGFAPAL